MSSCRRSILLFLAITNSSFVPQRDNISIVTSQPPKPEETEEFWKWQKESYTPTLLEGPTFIRARIYKEVGDPNRAGEVPSGPYMWVYEWEDDELPWMEMTDVGQAKEWVRLVEGGLVWQGLSYNTKRFSEKFENSLDLSGHGEDEGSEDEDGRNGE